MAFYNLDLVKRGNYIKLNKVLSCYAVRYLVPINTNNWARCVDKIRSQV